MAIHDYIISNATFPSVRSDINQVLQAIVSNNSNATAPSTTYAYQWWYDTNNNILKFRNASNNAWLDFASFDQSNNTWSITPNGYLEGRGDGTNQGKIRLGCEHNSHFVSIFAPPHSSSANWTWKLPVNSGSDGQVLSTNGQSVGQLSWINATETKPTITSSALYISPNSSSQVTIAGTNFVSIPIVEAINSSTGAIARASAVTFTSSTSIQATFNLPSANYFLRIENNDGNAVRSTNAILSASTSPTFSTSSGSLGSVGAGESASFTVSASSDSTIVYSITGSLPTGMSINSSTGVISGTNSGYSQPTTVNFTVVATDQENQTNSLSVSISITTGATGSAQFN